MFDYLIPIALGATALVILVGIFGMMKGGEFNRKYGKKLMQSVLFCLFCGSATNGKAN